MPIIRNPFRSKDENARPPSNGVDKTQPIDIERKEKDKEPTEYKLSEINDSGVFVPPSPPERKSFWPTSSSRSTTSSNPRSTFNENEPFNISRESFDSYRRSFDISARSPVIQATEQPRPRISLDSRAFQQPTPRSSNSFHRTLHVPRTQPEEDPSLSSPYFSSKNNGGTREDTLEDKLEDVALDDPIKPPHPPKKRGMLSRIMDSDSNSSTSTPPPAGTDSPKGSSWHHFATRKRGQSGQGAELGSLPSNNNNNNNNSNHKAERPTTPAQQTMEQQQQQTSTLSQIQTPGKESAMQKPEPQIPQQKQVQVQAQTQAPASRDSAQAAAGATKAPSSVSVEAKSS